MYRSAVITALFVLLLSCGCEREQSKDAPKSAGPPAQPSENVSPEAIFNRIVAGKIPHGHYDDLAQEIAAFGEKAFGVCAQMLKCTKDEDNYRKGVAIKALALLNDSRALPLLKEVALKEQNRGHLQQELLAVLTLDPTLDQADWSAHHHKPLVQTHISESLLFGQIRQW